jgi:hypothetical protein
MSVREIAGVFGQMGREPNMRSVSGILRISYEQLEGRSHLAGSVQASWALGVIAIALCAAFPFITEDRMRAALLKACGVSLVLFMGFLIGALTTRNQAKPAAAQEKAIAEMAVAFLNQIVTEPGFRAGQLDSLQKLTLQRLLKRTKSDSVALRQLVEV